MELRLRLGARGSVIGVVLAFVVLSAGQTPIAQADEASKAAKMAELVQLQGLAKMMEQSKIAGQETAIKLVRSMTDKAFAQFPAFPQDKRVAFESASTRFLQEVQSSFDLEDAVQAWGRFYSQGLTESELDSILAYHRSAVGQKDVSASQAALPQFQKYMVEKRTAAMNQAVAHYTEALRAIVGPAKAPAPQSTGADTPPPDAEKAASPP